MFNKQNFTFIEVMISLVILAIAAVSLTGVLSAISSQNNSTNDILITNQLSYGVKEKLNTMTIAQLTNWIKTGLELSASSNKGPIQGNGDQYSEFKDWKQLLTYQYLDDNDLSKTSGTPSKSLQINIAIYQNNDLKKEEQWFTFEK